MKLNTRLNTKQKKSRKKRHEEETASATIEGTWYWMDSPYYVFNADGTGLMLATPILWETRDGILLICTTPDSCGSIADCIMTMDWYYTVEGNVLTLESTIMDLTFTYIRQ